LRQEGFAGRPGVVHRLDLETSGVLLFSLSPEGHRALLRAWEEHAVLKEYSAIVLGWPHPRRGTIDLRLEKNASGRMVPSARGLPSLTRYRTLERFAGAAWLEVTPRTGRTHQIRVHLAARGTPVLGDRFYGPRKLPPVLPPPPRLCLHAQRLLLPAALVEELEPRERGSEGQPQGDWVMRAPEPDEIARYRQSLHGDRKKIEG
jgi:23S rRNA-/tRNA-specific pseudouridylate synthase